MHPILINSSLLAVTSQCQHLQVNRRAPHTITECFVFFGRSEKCAHEFCKKGTVFHVLQWRVALSGSSHPCTEFGAMVRACWGFYSPACLLQAQLSKWHLTFAQEWQSGTQPVPLPWMRRLWLKAKNWAETKGGHIQLNLLGSVSACFIRQCCGKKL
jgi:hypothetical protein